RPPDFELAQYWEHSKIALKQQLPRYPAELLVHPSVEPAIRKSLYVQIHEINLPDSDQAGWMSVFVDFHNLESAAEYVLGKGPFIKVIQPLELKIRILDTLKEIETLYAQS